MKKIFFLFFTIFCFSAIFCQEKSVEKIYTLTEVDVAPEFFKKSLKPSFLSKKNFAKNLRKVIAINLDVLKYNTKKEKVYVEFLVKKNGKIEVLQAKGKSKTAVKIAKRAIAKIKKMKPAKKDGKNVDMKYIVPITFNPAIHIDTTTKKRFYK